MIRSDKSAEESFVTFSPADLLCEYKTNPCGIEERYPRFSWISDCCRKNSYQSAYRVLVSSSADSLNEEVGDIWDSGKVLSDCSVQIIFSGKPLQSNRSYCWKVMVWNEKDEQSLWSAVSFFATGVFEQDEWRAKWISHIYPEEESGGIRFRENTDKWIWYPYVTPEERFRKIELTKEFHLDEIADILSAVILITADEKFRLFINNNPTAESDAKIFSWARPQKIDAVQFLCEGKNSIRIIGENSYVDKPGVLFRLEIVFGSGTVLEVLSGEDWTGRLAETEDQFVNAKIVAYAGEKPWRIPEPDLHFNPAAYIRKVFSAREKVKRAYAYCSALGLYHLRINGKEISDGKLLPGWSDYHKRAYYHSYDVTNEISSASDNIINVILADGYYSGYCGWEKGRGYYGKYPALKFQLMIQYADGTEEIIYTDNSWTSSSGPLTEADILMGERYDSRLENLIEGWENADVKLNHFKPVKVISNVNPVMTHYKAGEIKGRDVLPAQSITKISDNRLIIDFGQNFAGYVKLSLRDAGQREITLRFAEMLSPDGTLYNENFRMARAQDSYFSKGGSEEVWEPLFTYRGFRYCEVTGLEALSADEISGVSINSLAARTGWFVSSHEKLNKLSECILWNQKSNYMDIPTDCPQRDERFGWTGDASIYFRTASVYHDVSSFYNNWFEKLFDEQKESGALPPYAPFPDMGAGLTFFNSAGWADSGIITPFEFYEVYQDTTLLERYYEKMKLFLNSLEAESDNYILREYGYGDWLSVGVETSKSCIATAYFAYDAMLMSRIAAILGRKNDAVKFSRLFQSIRNSFRYKYIDESGLPVPLTQTSVILAIYFGLLEENETPKALYFLVNDIVARNYHTTAGFLGLALLMPVLSRAGRDDIAWKVLTNEEYPSWFYMIDWGATTLWEKWDSYHPKKGFNDPVMNSFNHCSLGSVGEWLWSGLGGIKKTKPGYKEFVIDPFVPAELNFVSASLKTIYGVIKSSWRKTGVGLVMEISVPFNTKADIFLPDANFTFPSQYVAVQGDSGRKFISTGSGNYTIEFELS